MCGYICVDSLALGLDFIFNHESSKALMVQHFTDLALVEPKVAVSNVAEAQNANEQQHVRVVSMAVRFKRIISQLVTVRLVMNVVLFLEGVSVRVAGENVLVAALGKRDVNDRIREKDWQFGSVKCSCSKLLVC